MTVAEREAPRWFIQNLATIRLGGDDTDGRFAVVEMVGPHGDMPPLHVHTSDDEIFLVLEGELTVFVGGDVLTGGPGAALFAPRGVPHTYRVESERARWCAIASPARFADFVAEASVPAEAPTLPPQPPSIDPDRLGELAARHGIEILGPPGALPS
jgi:quercetin dioxygenase-like cupin family protein